jgi:hypothetical protein
MTVQMPLTMSDALMRYCVVLTSLATELTTNGGVMIPPTMACTPIGRHEHVNFHHATPSNSHNH